MAKRKPKRRAAASKRRAAKSRPQKIRKRKAPAKRAAPKKSARKETPQVRKLRKQRDKDKQIIRNQRRIISDLTQRPQRHFKPDTDVPSAPDQPTMPRESFEYGDDEPESREEIPIADDGWYDEGFDIDDGIDDYGDYDDTDIYGDEV